MSNTAFIRTLFFDPKNTDEDVIRALAPALLDKALCVFLSTHGGTCRERLVALLKGGANPNAVACDGQTALQLAIRHATPNTSLECVRTLLDHGACPNQWGYMRVFEESGTREGSVRALAICANWHFFDMPGIARLLIERGAHPISKEEKEMTPPHLWYYDIASGVGHCLLAVKATERALTKTRLLHKDVIPLICHYILRTRCHSWWIDPSKK